MYEIAEGSVSRIQRMCLIIDVWLKHTAPSMWVC